MCATSGTSIINSHLTRTIPDSVHYNRTYHFPECLTTRLYANLEISFSNIWFCKKGCRLRTYRTIPKPFTYVKERRHWSMKNSLIRDSNRFGRAHQHYRQWLLELSALVLPIAQVQGLPKSLTLQIYTYPITWNKHRQPRSWYSTYK